jgi:hypothetical protein
MVRIRVITALLIVGVVAACGSQATPAPSSPASAVPSASAVIAAAASSAPSPSPSPTPSTAPTATPQPTPTLAPTPAPTPIPWKTYTSKRYHYKIKYPPDWIVTPGTTKLSDAFDHFDYPYIYVFRDTVTGSVSISATVTAQVAFYKSHYKAKLVSNASITLAGWSGRLLTFSGVDDGLKVIIKEAIVGKGKVGYFITMFGEPANAEADRDLFKKMYLTWRPT